MQLIPDVRQQMKINLFFALGQGLIPFLLNGVVGLVMTIEGIIILRSKKNMEIGALLFAVGIILIFGGSVILTR